MQNFKLAPSLLSADFARLGEEAAAVLSAGADMLHLDVMDNHYVPNLTVGPLVCQALRDFGIQAPIDVHLMTQPVDDLIDLFAKAGASHITIHPEASLHVDRSLNLIKKHGCRAGLALNPSTPLHGLEYVLHHVDIIMVMSVNPGFGGQSFIPSSLKKITEVRKMVQDLDHPIDIAVDGGVNVDNIATIAKAGANMFVAGSAIFGQSDYADVIHNMRKALKGVSNDNG